jgi:hypothetical protein
MRRLSRKLEVKGFESGLRKTERYRKLRDDKWSTGRNLNV